MKIKKLPAQTSRLSAETQSRLLAYSTAASLGAFFGGQSTEAAVVQAPGLAPYPRVFLPPALGSTNAVDFYLSIDGGSITNFHLFITGDLTSHPTNKTPAQVVRMPGWVPDTNNPGVVNGQLFSALRGTSTAAHGLTNSYCVAFLGGAIIGNNTNTVPPWYQPQLGISYNLGSTYPWKNYVNSSFQNGFPNTILGFKFISSVDGQEHFGYMDVKSSFPLVRYDHLDINGNPTNTSVKVLSSLVINNCVYETTPSASITVPTSVKIISVVNQGGYYYITFGLNSAEEVDSSIFVVETSPTLGAAASWTPDPNATVYQLTAVSHGNPIKPGTFQALVLPNEGVTSQFWRINRQQ